MPTTGGMRAAAHGKRAAEIRPWHERPRSWPQEAQARGMRHDGGDTEKDFVIKLPNQAPETARKLADPQQ